MSLCISLNLNFHPLFQPAHLEEAMILRNISAVFALFPLHRHEHGGLPATVRIDNIQFSRNTKVDNISKFSIKCIWIEMLTKCFWVRWQQCQLCILRENSNGDFPYFNTQSESKKHQGKKRTNIEDHFHFPFHFLLGWIGRLGSIQTHERESENEIAYDTSKSFVLGYPHQTEVNFTVKTFSNRNTFVFTWCKCTVMVWSHWTRMRTIPKPITRSS